MVKMRLVAVCYFSFGFAVCCWGGSIYSESPASLIKAPTVDQGLKGSPLATEVVVDVDVTGMMSCNNEGAPENSTLNVNFYDLLGSPSNEPVVLTGIGWSMTQTSGLDPNGESWLSEMTFAVDYEGEGNNDLFLTPSGTDGPGTEMNDSSGIITLADIGVADGIMNNGIAVVELFESFVDDAGSCEGVIDSGVLMFDVTVVPEPSAMGLFAVAFLGIGGLRCRR